MLLLLLFCLKRRVFPCILIAGSSPVGVGEAFLHIIMQCHIFNFSILRSWATQEYVMFNEHGSVIATWHFCMKFKGTN